MVVLQSIYFIHIDIIVFSGYKALVWLHISWRIGYEFSNSSNGRYNGIWIITTSNGVRLMINREKELLLMSLKDRIAELTNILDEVREEVKRTTQSIDELKDIVAELEEPKTEYVAEVNNNDGA